ncbi:DUF2891 family protein [Actinocatenispora comari]|uniref:DUF2891 domain-containing protein n=1 Tax=Actinocatenispora comari TaxID=2807577 RepID=A0A8J4ENR9_9ACTN|nr:DUF2891 family protein [Actinocatenispora comari]GIL24772.1 hypothetical protein NUM_00270 [Actinocatenispora comari]GIL30565.1 hypothetical protein NUM_58190 [Actinocatenispora comari]
MSERLAELAGTLAETAIRNIRTEFPYASQHVTAGPDDTWRPRRLHPAFGGAYDWHSCVHMHWLLIRLRTDYPQWIDVAAVEAALGETLTPAAIRVEADYLRSHPEFERPYGWAWAYVLAGVADRCPAGARWSAALGPLADAVSSLALRWLDRTPAPVRHGTHANTAFALSLLLDGAQARGDETLAARLRDRANDWYRGDRDYPIGWEPSGQDFLSAGLSEADLMRRVLPAGEFPAWLTNFLPPAAGPHPPEAGAAELSAAGRNAPEAGGAEASAAGPGAGLDAGQSLGLRPVAPLDPGDSQQSHLYGLGLSRAWQLRALAAALPADDPRVAPFRTLAETETQRCLGALTSGSFLTAHWLATFACLALADDPGTVGANQEGTR